MTILERFQAPTKTAKAKAKDVRSRVADVASDTKSKVNDAKSAMLSDDAKRELTEALELIMTKVRESASLAKLQDEAHRQLSDALESAKDKVKDAAPAAKAKLQEAGHDAAQKLPSRRKRRSKLRTVMMIFTALPATIGVIVALKKKLASRNGPVDDYDAGGELAWGESSFNPATEASTATAEASNAAYEPAVSSVPASGAAANGVVSNRMPGSSSTPDAPSSELLNE